MKNFFREYFNFSKKERNGVAVLLILILIAFSIPYVYEYFNKSKPLNYKNFNDKINKLYANNLSDNNTFKKNKNNKNSNIKLFDFDPNTVTKQELIKLGFSKKTCNTFLNYRKSGAKFYKPEDLKNIYGITEHQYKKIEPYIKIKQSERIVKKEYKQQKIAETTTNKRIEINSADSLQLVSLSGIGKVLASRIIKYRAFLGGFYSTHQLTEVYGITKATVLKIEKHLIVDTSLIQTLNLNTVKFKALNNHPYMSYAETKAVFKYRQLMGKFENYKQLIKNNLVDTSTYRKIKPYIVID